MREKAELLLKIIKEQGLPITALALVLAWMYYLDWTEREKRYLNEIRLEERLENYSQEIRSLNRQLLECYQEQIEETNEQLEAINNFLKKDNK